MQNIFTLETLSLFGLLVSIAVTFLAMLAYFWYRRLAKALEKDFGDIAGLVAQKNLLEQQIKSALEYLEANKQELLKLEAERQFQEKLRLDLAELQTSCANLEKEQEGKRREGTELQELVARLNDEKDKRQQEAEQLRHEVEKKQSEAKNVEKDLERLNGEKDRLTKLLDDKQKEIKGKESELLELVTKVHGEGVRASALAGVIEAKERQKLELENEIKGLVGKRPGGNGAGGLGTFDSIYLEPPCLKPNFKPSTSYRKEEDRFSEFKSWLDHQGLVFPDRILKAFHTSLKVSDFSSLTVLAGVSGTGKTLLPLMYADFMGMYSHVVSVQPRWDSPQDLLGFYNFVEKSYESTQLVQALVHMDPYNHHNHGGNKKNAMLLVLLDEMNLARVEYYFSEFLSKLELRRQVNGSQDTESRQRAEIFLGTVRTNNSNGNGSQADKVFAAPRLWVPNNVLFVGTMNEDENTQTLSDKVLDRANVLRFGKPARQTRKSRGGERSLNSERNLSFDEWKSWLKNDFDSNLTKQREEVEGWINELNDALGKIGRPMGYRVQDAIRAYVCNYPGIADGRSHRFAFADQVAQKVMPRLRGIDCENDSFNEARSEIEKVLEDVGDRALIDAFEHGKTSGMANTGMFEWRGIDYGPDSENQRLTNL